MYKKLAAVLCINYLLFPVSIISGGPQTDNDTSNRTLFRLTPLSSLTIGAAHLSTTYPVGRYTFPNQDGTFADKGLNYFLTATGNGAISTFSDFFYDIRINNVEGLRFKKGSLFLRTRSVSLEAGRNNIWLGNSYYGSLLLSNNAEPYTLIRFRTEQPFRIPYIGNFDYTLFHGWPRRFNIIGHMLSWYPASWFEFNIKQTIVYTGKYTFFEYLNMFTARKANLRDGLGETNSRASFEIAVNLKLLPNILPVINNSKLYLEYGGEDFYAKWQKADERFDKNLWIGPFGFQLLDTAILSGISLQTDNSTFVLEYAQNYKNHYLFYDPYNGNRPYNFSWYRHRVQPPFTNNEALMGHHMGHAAEMFMLYYEHSFSAFSTAFLFSRRHRWNINLDDWDSYKINSAERQDSFHSKVQYQQNPISVSLRLILNLYNNVDSDNNLVRNIPVGGVTARDILVGVFFTYRF